MGWNGIRTCNVPNTLGGERSNQAISHTELNPQKKKQKNRKSEIEEGGRRGVKLFSFFKSDVVYVSFFFV